MGNITILLGEMRSGNATARSDLYTLVYSELTRIAKSRIARGDQKNLDAPSLVHEAYLRLSDQEIPSLHDRRDFFAYSATVMRNVIIDTLRHDNAQKRGSGVTALTLSSAEAEFGQEAPDVEALHGAMELLQRIDQRAHRIVEMRYFAGMTYEEIAEVLDLSSMTVKRSWKTARTFLFKELNKSAR
jgi:RNA polymerase sigma factor (TIGR02999 family)